MKIRFVGTSPDVHGGMGLAMRRLALALVEVGHECDIVVPRSLALELSDGITFVAGPGLTLPSEQLGPAPVVAATLAAGAPDLLVVADHRAELLEAAARVGPTLLHSHMHWPSCPDSGRYWNRLGAECRVEAGWKCLALRPVLGCSSADRLLRPRPVLDHQRLRRTLRRSGVGVLAISGRQARLAVDHGVPERRLAVVPNLGMRLTEGELRDAAEATPDGERSAITFFGRLSKEKGAQLLPALALPPGARLGVYGDGYLEADLRRSLGGAVRGRVDQAGVAGAMQWASGTVFPSLWPEPGGIVGIDAQLFGVPLAAFDLGAALDWPGAARFRPADVDALAAWARTLAPRAEPRPAAPIAEAQARYWSAVARRVDGLVRSFVADGAFPDPGYDAVTEDLRHAGVTAP